MLEVRIPAFIPQSAALLINQMLWAPLVRPNAVRTIRDDDEDCSGHKDTEIAPAFSTDNSGFLGACRDAQSTAKLEDFGGQGGITLSLFDR